jgi:hypothetical protein
MPLVSVQNEESQDAVDISKLLFKEDGTLTLEGEVLQDFLDDVDFDDVFEDAEVRESGILTIEKKWGIEADDDVIEAAEGDEGAKEFEVATISGEDFAEVVDHVENEMPTETLEEKARKKVAEDILDEAKYHPYKKGDFKRIHRAGGAALVNRMLGAMLNKQAIQRAAGGPGTGYKKGDYDKRKPGYGQGTATGVRRWKMYKMKKKAELTQKEKKTKKAKKVGKRFAKKAQTKKGAAGKLAKKKTGKAKISASEEPSGKQIVSEGARLSGKMLGVMESSSLTPKAEKKDEK